MAITGDLEQLHIADIIQLIHTTRKSGTFSVKGERGESRIIFSNGYIVGASHLNGRVRIGSVLVKLKAITQQALEEALNEQKRAGRDRRPLISTLIHLGKVRHEDAFKGLKRLIEVTIVELMTWTRGTFTFDPDAIDVSPECRYEPGAMEQEMSLDAQMVLMDSLRVFDERERDRLAGKAVAAYEESYADVLPQFSPPKPDKAGRVITADDLGLADLDRLESKIPEPSPAIEVFDPVEIHRQKVRENLADFPVGEQESLVTFLEASAARIGGQDAQTRQEVRATALVLFSGDEILKYAVMTICKKDGAMVFATDAEAELDRIIAQCHAIRVAPLVVFDSPSARGVPAEVTASLRRRTGERHPQAVILQLAAADEYAFSLDAYQDGVQAVIPRPMREAGRMTFVKDIMHFLEAFQVLTREAHLRQDASPDAGDRTRRLAAHMVGLRGLDEPADVSRVLLWAVAECFERVMTFSVGSAEAVGEMAVGFGGTRDIGPVPAAVRIPLGPYSVFRDVIDTGQMYYGDTDDEVLQGQVFVPLGRPLSPGVLILPVKRQGMTVALVYGDFGGTKASPAPVDALDMIAQHAGLVLENAQYRRQIQKTGLT